MAEVHIVNVAPGDCTIIRHNSGRCTVMDICCGNSEASIKSFGLLQALEELSTNKPGGNECASTLRTRLNISKGSE